MKQKKDLSDYLIGFAIGVLAGCLYMNILWRCAPFLNLNERSLAMSMLQENDTYRFFWEAGLGVLAMLIYVFTLCSGFTYLGVLLSKGFCFAAGIWWGAFLTECILIKGILFLREIVVLLMPESVLYLAAYGSGLIWVNNMSTSFSVKRKEPGKTTIKFWKNLSMSLFFCVLWCISWYYVNCK